MALQPEPEPDVTMATAQRQQRADKLAAAAALSAAPRRFHVGQRVEARPVRWYDDLFWLGTIEAENNDGSFQVAMENGDTEESVPNDPLFILPFTRASVFEGKEVLVFDGHRYKCWCTHSFVQILFNTHYALQFGSRPRRSWTNGTYQASIL